MKFLEVRNNKMHGDDLPEEVCRELIRIDRIEHIYIPLPDETSICIEYKDRKGRDCDVYEDFEHRGPCTVRFNEISKLLTEGE